jgi:hypothetical protein
MLKRVDPATLKELYAKHRLRWRQGIIAKTDCCCVLGILLLEENLERVHSTESALSKLIGRDWDYEYLMGLWQGFDIWRCRSDDSENKKLGYADGLACWKELNNVEAS